VKYIVKGDEPKSFTEWKALANDDWKPTYDQLSGQVKKDVKNALITEQGNICCYCERKLSYDDSHIEHLNPQCSSSEGQLDFQNMLCSCHKHLKKKEPLYCGNSKGDDILLITSLQKNCEEKFTYTEDGYINFTDSDSEQTIKSLQLSIDKLNDLRKQVIEPFIIDPMTMDEISDVEAKKFANEYLKIKDGKFNEFYTTIKYLFT
jgi:uncharacterized protein (TIGR02646 family)